MPEFAVEPQRGASIGELGSFDPAASDRRAGDALVETGQRRGGVGCGFYVTISNGKRSYAR